MRCEKCGAELKPDAKFCGKCGTIVSEASRGTATSSGKSGGGVGGVRRIPTGVNKMPQGIALGVDERVVKEYKIGRYSFRQGEIVVIVTNKRVIRYEESSLFGMQNNQIDEVNIDAVHGTLTHMRRSISTIGLIAAIILAVFGLTTLFGGGYMGIMEKMIGIVAIVIAAVIMLASLRPMLEFALLGSVGGTVLGTIVNKRGRIIRDDSNSIIFQFKPTAETTVMLKEIGACIYDLKTLGDAAIEKWS